MQTHSIVYECPDMSATKLNDPQAIEWLTFSSKMKAMSSSLQPIEN